LKRSRRRLWQLWHAVLVWVLLGCILKSSLTESYCNLLYIQQQDICTLILYSVNFFLHFDNVQSRCVQQESSGVNER
jgi:hypothetical protein